MIVRRCIYIVCLLINFVTISYSQVNKTIRIDIDNSRGGSVSQIFNDIMYIPLETNKESTFGEISQLEVFHGYFIILDRNTDAILIFNCDNGKFLAKCSKIIGLRKNDNIYRNYFGSFSIDRNNNLIVVKSELDKEKLYLFDLNGKQVGQIFNSKIKNIQGFTYLKNAVVYEQFRTIRPKSFKMEPYDVFIADTQFNNIKNKLFPYDSNRTARDIVFPKPFQFFYVSGRDYNMCYYSRPYDYNVYQLNCFGNIDTVFKFIFPLELTLPNNFTSDEDLYKGKRWDYLLANKKKIFSINNFYSIHNVLFFQVNSLSTMTERNCSLLYNMKTENTILLSHVIPDSVTSNLPFINNIFPIEACDGHYVYSSISALTLFTAKKGIKQNLKVPSELHNFFKNSNEKSNPVIVRLGINGSL